MACPDFLDDVYGYSEFFFDNADAKTAGREFAKERDLTPGDNPYCVHDAGYVTQQCQQNIQPECAAEAHLQKYAERRQQNSDQHAKEIHKVIPLHLKFGGALIL